MKCEVKRGGFHLGGSSLHFKSFLRGSFQFCLVRHGAAHGSSQVFLTWFLLQGEQATVGKSNGRKRFTSLFSCLSSLGPFRD